MKTIVLLGIVVMPYAAFAATDCRVVEYPDHYEAICKDDAPQVPTASASTASSSSPASPSPAASASSQAPEPGQVQLQEHLEQTFDALLAAQEQAQQANADGEAMIVISDLGRRHAEEWLRRQPHQ